MKNRFVLGAVTFAAMALFIVAVFGGAIFAPFQPSTHTVSAVFANTAQLRASAPVRVHGVDVGKVSAVRATPDGRSAVVEMKLRDGAPALYRDATAGIRWRLLLGASYDVELSPGSAASGALGSRPIPRSQTSSQVEFDELISTFGPDQRRGLRTLLAQTPHAFSDADAPRRALEAVSDRGRLVTRGLRSVRGTDADHDLKDLTRNTARTARALAAPTDGIERLIEGGGATLEATARRATAIRQSLAIGSRTIPAVRQTLTRLNRTLGFADPVLTSLRGPSAAVAPTARQLQPQLVATDHLLDAARPLLRSLPGTADALAGLARNGQPLLRQLEPSLRRVDERILPDLAKPDRISKRPTYEMIGPTAASFTAVAGNFDAVSHYVALDAAAGDPKVDTAGCKTYFSDLKPDQLVDCQTLLTAVGALLGARPPATKGHR